SQHQRRHAGRHSLSLLSASSVEPGGEHRPPFPRRYQCTTSRVTRVCQSFSVVTAPCITRPGCAPLIAARAVTVTGSRSCARGITSPSSLRHPCGRHQEDCAVLCTEC